MALNNVSKAIGAFLTAFAGWLTAVTVSDSSDINSGEWVTLATIAITVLTVYFLKNEPVNPQ